MKSKNFVSFEDRYLIEEKKSCEIMERRGDWEERGGLEKGRKSPQPLLVRTDPFVPP